MQARVCDWLNALVWILLLSAAVIVAAQETLRIGVTLHPYYSWTLNVVDGHAEVIPLLPPNADPHTYQPQPKDLRRITGLDAIVMNGRGHDEFLTPMLKAADNRDLHKIDLHQGVPLVRQLGKNAIQGYLPQGFEHGFMVRGALAALILGPLLGGIGTLVVSRKLAFFTQTIGHASLTGVALGLLFGEPLGETYAGLYGFSMLVALLTLYVKNRSGASSDTVVGVILAQTLGVGIVMLVLVTKRFDVHQIEAMLFGSLLTISEKDLLILAVVSLISVVVLLALFNRFWLLCFNVSLAQARGAKPVLIEYTFVLLATLIVVSSLKLIGALLVLALVVVPAAAAGHLARGVTSYFWYSVLFATLSMMLGLVVSSLWSMPTGAAIVLFSAGLFYLSLIYRTLNRGRAAVKNIE